jgi:hypothetical protein
MEPFGLPKSPLFEKYVFNANSASAGANWHTWFRPVGKSYLTMLLIGGGGGGGTGVMSPLTLFPLAVVAVVLVV